MRSAYIQLLAILFFLSIQSHAESDIQIQPVADPNINTSNVDTNLPVKKSSSGICHTPKSSFYSRTKNFIPFPNIEECLKSGGRMPKR